MFPARIPIISNPPSGFTNTYSLDFDGSDDYIDLGANLDPGTNVRTYTFWLKTTQTAIRSVIGNRQVNGSTGFVIQVADTEVMFYNNATGNRFQWIPDAGTLTDGVWHHFAFVRTLTSNSLGGIYFDGVLQTRDGSYWNENLGDTAGVLNMSIGRQHLDIPGTYQRFLDGKLDEVAIWDAALTAGSITNIYNGGVPTDLLADSNSGSLIGWWRFEEGSGTSVADSSTNSNTGTLTNGPAHSTDVPL